MNADPLDVSLVRDGAACELLRVFNQAGLLAPADVHVATRLAALAGDTDQSVTLALALAVRAPRVGNVSVDLATVQAVAVAGPGEDDVDADPAALPWPPAGEWVEAVAASALVATFAGTDRPLRLEGTHLYLDRYWRDEQDVAADLLSRAATSAAVAPDEERLRSALRRLFPGERSADQSAAAEAAVRRRFCVVAGGPGTGKTTTVARLLALLFDQGDARPPLVALAAPTGKAAARLEEAVRAEAATLDAGQEARRWLAGLSGSTIHRLLGSRGPGSSLFRHGRHLRLPHDVVVVDEASMIPLALMARLVEAVRPDARLVLVGDPEQLVSVEAGAVLADIVGPGGGREGGARDRRPGDPGPPAGAGDPGLAPGAGDSGPPPTSTSPPAGLSASIVVLRANHRFSGVLADLAEAVRSGDADFTIELLAGGAPAATWVARDEAADAGEAAALRPLVAAWACDVVAAARRGDESAALAALRRNRVLCAHRQGPHGAAAWNEVVERWIVERWPELASEGTWYTGRPVLVSANDYSLQLFNGDTGVAVADPEGAVSVAFPSGPGNARRFGPSRLAGVETVFAMTVHKSQGSEFERVTLVLPPEGSRLLTRELLYTALTRAREEVVVAGTEAAVRAAVERPIARASGLGPKLWGET